MKCKHEQIERYVPETPRAWTRLERCVECGATRIVYITDGGTMVPRSKWSNSEAERAKRAGRNA